MSGRQWDPHGLGSFGTGTRFRAEAWWDPDLEQAGGTAAAFDDSLMAAIVPPRLSIVQVSPSVVSSGMIPPDRLPT